METVPNRTRHKCMVREKRFFMSHGKLLNKYLWIRGSCYQTFCGLLLYTA